jgi:hypothetical protein
MYGKPYTFTPSACPHMVPLSYGSLSVVHAYARRPFAYLYNPYHFLNPKGFTPSYMPRAAAGHGARVAGEHGRTPAGGGSTPSHAKAL